MTQLLQILKNPTVRYILKLISVVAAAAAGFYSTQHATLPCAEATAAAGLATLATVQGLTATDMFNAAQKIAGNLCVAFGTAMVPTQPMIAAQLAGVGAWLMSGTIPPYGTNAKIEAAARTGLSQPPAVKS